MSEFEWDRALDNGFERCVRCGIVFGAEDRNDDIRGKEHGPGIGMGINYTYGPVKNKNGNEYDHVEASPPGSYLMHPDCYREYHAELAAERNKGLDEF